MHLTIPELGKEHPPAGVYKAARVLTSDRRVVVAAQRPADGTGGGTAEGLIGCDLAIVGFTRCGHRLADALEYWVDEVREWV